MPGLIGPRGLSYLPQPETSFTSIDVSFKPLNPTFPRFYSRIQFTHVKSIAGKRIKVESRSIKRLSIKRLHPIQASASQSSGGTDKWVFEFVGDGNSSHIGQVVSPPKAFELTTDVATVGRLPEKADIVIPVATVSGIHARLERKEGILFVTDLNSTNGTYIDDTRVTPGAVTALSVGTRITFGDTNLASFRFSKEEGSDSPIKVASSNEVTNSQS